MKMYNNGQRKAMMYGGMSKRKPMMYGGMAQKKKPRKKAQAGGMMSTTPMQQNMSMKQQQPRMMMAAGDVAMKGDLDKDGKMSGYEKARQTAINKSMASKGKKKTSA